MVPLFRRFTDTAHTDAVKNVSTRLLERQFAGHVLSTADSVSCNDIVQR